MGIQCTLHAVYRKCFCYRTMHAVSFLIGNNLGNVMCVHANSLLISQKLVTASHDVLSLILCQRHQGQPSFPFHGKWNVLECLAPHIAQTKMQTKWLLIIFYFMTRLCPPMTSEATTANSGEVGNEGIHSDALNHFRNLICTSKTH